MLNKEKILSRISAVALSLFPLASFASTGATAEHAVDLTATWFGIASVIIFVVAYGFVINEEFLHLRKSKPVIVAAGVIWALIGVGYALEGQKRHPRPSSTTCWNTRSCCYSCCQP